jgi:hypothetical protein
VFGAVLNFGLHLHAPDAGDLVNRVLDPGLRHSLGTAELAQLKARRSHRRFTSCTSLPAWPR